MLAKSLLRQQQEQLSRDASALISQNSAQHEAQMRALDRLSRMDGGDSSPPRPASSTSVFDRARSVSPAKKFSPPVGAPAANGSGSSPRAITMLRNLRDSVRTWKEDELGGAFVFSTTFSLMMSFFLI